MQFASDIHSIATNLDQAALAEIAMQLRHVAVGIAALTMISTARFLIEFMRWKEGRQVV